MGFKELDLIDRVYIVASARCLVAAFPLDSPKKYVDEIVQIIPAKYNTKSDLTVVLVAEKVVEHDIHRKSN
jgi:hypothetical protein